MYVHLSNYQEPPPPITPPYPYPTPAATNPAIPVPAAQPNPVDNTSDTASLQPPVSEPLAGDPEIYSTTMIELDPTLDGFSQVKPTHFIVVRMTKGSIPEYLSSFPSVNQKWNGLLVSVETFIAIAYEEIAPTVMPILRDYQRNPNHTIQAFLSSLEQLKAQ